MISYYEFQWFFNTSSAEDLLTGRILGEEIKEYQNLHSGVDLSMIPQQGYQAVAQQAEDLYRMSTKNVITFADQEKMLKVFRQVTDTELKRQCPKSHDSK